MISHRKLGILVIVALVLAVLVVGASRTSVAYAGGDPPPSCSEPTLDPGSGRYYVVCKPGAVSAPLVNVWTRKIGQVPGAAIKVAASSPAGVRIEFTVPQGACYSWILTDSNGNQNQYTRGYPNPVAPYCGEFGWD